MISTVWAVVAALLFVLSHGPIQIWPVVREGLPPTPTATAVPTPTPIPDRLNEEQMLGLLVRTGWPEAQHQRALGVSYCESRWQRKAYNDEQRDGLGSTGLFQLWSGWYRAAGLPYEDWMIPEVNAMVALFAWEAEGWAPWSCAR